MGLKKRTGLRGQHILTITQFSTADIEEVFSEADWIRRQVEGGQVLDLCRGQIMTALFYEASTRTSSSFLAAMQRLGGGIIPITGVQYSSVSKGETFEDTVRTLEAYGDVMVLRHPEKGSAKRAASILTKPLINAGDGIGEHPTQALLDAYTIKRLGKSGRLEKLRVTMVGDLKYGRTIHSLARLLALYDVRMRFVSPASLRIPGYLRKALRAKKARFSEHRVLGSILRSTDVLYVTRIQKERFTRNPDAYEAVKNAFVITPRTLRRLPKKSIVMHPLPRVGEIARSVDRDQRAVYFKQVELGMYVRMALLKLVLGR